MTSKTLPWFVRINYPLRTIGWALGCVVVGASVYSRDPEPLGLAFIAGFALLWPHVAFLHVRTAYNVRTAEFRNITLDAAVSGVLSVYVSFSLIPTTIFIFASLFTSLGQGGWRLATRSSIAYGVGTLLAGLVGGFTFIPAVEAMAAWISLICIIALIIPAVTLAYRGNRRLIQLRNYLPSRIASLVMNTGNEDLLRPRRVQVVVCALDLRGFTAFAESAQPEEVLALLREYYSLVGNTVEECGGTVERFAGDGMIAFFNAPVDLANPEECAVRASLRIQTEFRPIREAWKLRGYDLGLGIGLSCGHATVGAIGFRGQWQYAAIGTVTNLASRLCALASHGEVLAAADVVEAIARYVESESRGERDIRGLSRPVAVFNLESLREGAEPDWRAADPLEARAREAS